MDTWSPRPLALEAQPPPQDNSMEMAKRGLALMIAPNSSTPLEASFAFSSSYTSSAPHHNYRKLGKVSDLGYLSKPYENQWYSIIWEGCFSLTCQGEGRLYLSPNLRQNFELQELFTFQARVLSSFSKLGSNAQEFLLFFNMWHFAVHGT